MILAQGVSEVHSGGPQVIPDSNILPFPFGNPPPANSDFNTLAQTFTELELSINTTFRANPSGVTQDRDHRFGERSRLGSTYAAGR